MLIRVGSYRCQSFTTPLYCTRCGKLVKAPAKGNAAAVKRHPICNRCKLK